MVIINYEQHIQHLISQQLQLLPSSTQLHQCIASQQLFQLIVKLYEYCEELNIIKRRIEKLKFLTDNGQLIMPKLIDSQVTRIDSKAKEIGTAYSLFLVHQKKFKVLSKQANYYQQILKIIVTLAVEKCFNKEDGVHLAKFNRLFRTNTFNTKSCWEEYKEKMFGISGRRRLKAQTNFRVFRKSVYAEKSLIKPYVNNQSCYRSLFSRSPIISLWHPNNQFLEFKLALKGKKKVIM